MNAEESMKVRVGADVTDAERILTGFAGNLKKEFAGIAGSVASGILGANLFSNLLSGIKKFGSQAKETLNKSMALGVSPEAFQAIKKLAGKSSVSEEAAISGLEKLNVNIGDAINGSKEAADKFEKWGISLRDMRTGQLKPTEEILKEIMDLEHGTADAATRAAIAHDLFGKAGQSLVAVLMKGSNALKQAKGAFTVFSKEELEDMADANAQLKTMSQSLEVLGARAYLKVSHYSPFSIVSRFMGGFSGGGLKEAFRQAFDPTRPNFSDATGKQLADQAAEAARQAAVQKADALNKLAAIEEKIAFEHAGLEGQIALMMEKRHQIYLKLIAAQKEFGADAVETLDIKGAYLEADNQVEKLLDKQKEKLSKEAQLEQEIADTKKLQEKIEGDLRQAGLSAEERAKIANNLQQIKLGMLEKEKELRNLHADQQARLNDLLKERAKIQSDFEDNFKMTVDEAAQNGDPNAQRVLDLRASAEEKRKRGDSKGAQFDLQNVSDLINGRYIDPADQKAYDIANRAAHDPNRSPEMRKWFRHNADAMKQGVLGIKNSERDKDPFAQYMDKQDKFNQKFLECVANGTIKVSPQFAASNTLRDQ